ncbi:hypothetical protein LTR94_029618, partial [Friedmanniomyces endolithicus]
GQPRDAHRARRPHRALHARGRGGGGAQDPDHDRDGPRLAQHARGLRLRADPGRHRDPGDRAAGAHAPGRRDFRGQRGPVGEDRRRTMYRDDPGGQQVGRDNHGRDGAGDRPAHRRRILVLPGATDPHRRDRAATGQASRRDHRRRRSADRGGFLGLVRRRAGRREGLHGSGDEAWLCAVRL